VAPAMTTPAQLAEIARGFQVRLDEVVGPLATGPLMRAFLVRTDRGPVVLKLFSPEERAAGAREAAILAHLGAAPDPRYRVPRLVGDARDLDGGALAMATFYEAGEHKRYTAFTSDEWRALGESLGALHTRLRALPAQSPSQSTSNDLPRLSARVAARDLDSERREIDAQAEAAARREPSARVNRYFAQRRLLLDERGPRASAAPPAGFSEQPIHNDYNQHNYLFSDGQRPLIVDWEKALLASREFEVVRCLSLVPLTAPVLAHAFLDGYRACEPLDRDLLAHAVDLCFVEHALKHWSTRAWLRGEPWAESHFHEHFDVLAALTDGRHALDRFYADEVAC
jgi:Ser/Thr protein kinase RdoA (MazF antagonist)